jgi:tetratricopeptide (TPR) repeat protein
VSPGRKLPYQPAPAALAAASSAPPVADLDASDLAAMIHAGRYADLETKTREIVRGQPNCGLAWKALGVSLTRQGKDALHALAVAATLLPDDAEAHANLGNALHGLGRLVEAAASYARTLALRPDFAEAHSNLGNTLRGLGRLEDAAASYSRALALKPDCAVTHHNKGNALLELERFEDAAASYSRALALKPDLAEAHSNLGNALRSLGRLDEAAASYRRALALKPAFAGAHSNLSDTLRDLGQIAEAADSARRAIEIDPELAGAHNSSGNALMDLGKLEEAAASYRRALALKPGFTAACINLGLVLRQLGRTAEAEESCRAVLETHPNAAAAVVLLAELRADRGQFAEAEELFRRAAAIDPKSPEAWAGIAHLRKMTVGDAAWAAQAQRMAEQPLPPRDEVYLRFAIGKYLDDVREFEGAFANFRRAHELKKRYGERYDRQRMAQGVDRAIRSYDREWARRPRADAIPSARPVFVVGMPRSGTSLAEQILAAHPAIFGAGELPFWNSAASMYESLAWSGEPSGDIYPKLAADYLRLLEKLSAGALRVVDKMPANFLSLGLIHEALPNARIIHMRRNPIDTCLSIYFQHFKSAHSYADDLDDLVHYYGEYSRLMKHWRNALPADAILEVPYEGLVDDQEGWSRKILQFVGIPWEPRCLDFHRADRSVMTASKWQVRQKINRSSVERWRNYEKFIGPLRSLPIR